MADTKDKKETDTTEAPAIGETIPGGRFIVDGRTVNADGKEIDKDGKEKK